MALVYHTELSGNSILGIWEVTETPENLISQLCLEEEDLTRYNRFTHDSRRAEWLSARLMIKE